MQESVRSHYTSLSALKQKAEELAKEKETADKRTEGMREQYKKLEESAEVMRSQLRLYSGEDGVDLETLERALTLCKKRSEALSSLPFKGDAKDEEMLMLPYVKRKLSQVQLVNLQLTEELERLENMLKLQNGINRDLHEELENLVTHRDKG